VCSKALRVEVVIPDRLQVQLHVHQYVHNHVHILHLKKVKVIVDLLLNQVEVIVHLQEVVHQVIVDPQVQVVLEEVIQVGVPAGVPVGVAAGVVVRNNYILR